MNFQKLRKTSQKDNKRREFILSLGKSYDYASFMRYLIHRVRYAFSFKIIFRLIALLELAILYNLYPVGTFSQLALFVLILILSKSVFNGLSQYYRVTFFSSLVKNDISTIRTKLAKATFTALIFGVVFGVINFIIFQLLLTGYSLTLLLLIVWNILIPLDAVQQIIVSTVYLKARLHRSPVTILNLRLIPIAVLIAYGQTGATAYILAIFLSELLEKAYLVNRALKILKIDNLSISLNLWKELTALLKNKLILKYFSFSSTLPLYHLGTIAILIERGYFFWHLYIVYFFLQKFLVFFPVQIVKSLGLDIYFCIRTGRHEKALYLSRKALTYSTIISIIAAVFLLYSFIHYNYLLLLLPRGLGDLILYLLIGFVVQGIFFSICSLIQVASLDKYFAKSLRCIFIYTALPLQFISSYFLRTNLQAVYLIELFAYLVAGLVLLKRTNYYLSPFYKIALKRTLYKLPFCHASLLVNNARVLKLVGNKPNLYLLSFFDRDKNANVILKSLPQEKGTLVCNYIDNFYLVSTDLPVSRYDFINSSIKSFLNLGDSTDLAQTIISIYRFLYLDYAHSNPSKSANPYYFDYNKIKEICLMKSFDDSTDLLLPELKSFPHVYLNYKSISNSFLKRKSFYNRALEIYFSSNNGIITEPEGAISIIFKSPEDAIIFDLHKANGYLIHEIKRKVRLLNQVNFFKYVHIPELNSGISYKDYLLLRFSNDLNINKMLRSHRRTSSNLINSIDGLL